MQYEELLRIVDADGSGAIDYLEFANTIKPVDETDDEVTRFWLTMRRIVTNCREFRPILGNFWLRNWRFFDQGRAIDTTAASAAGATKDVPYAPTHEKFFFNFSIQSI